MRTLKTILKLLKEYKINYEDIVAIDNQGGAIKLDKLDTKDAKLTTDGIFGDFLVETKALEIYKELKGFKNERD